MFLFDLFTGGIFGGVSKIFGTAGGAKPFAGGGSIPGAAGGITLPGAGVSDSILIRGTPRERILTERQAQEVDRLRQQGGAGGGPMVENFYFSPLFSTGSPAQVERALKTLNRLNERGGL